LRLLLCIVGFAALLILVQYGVDDEWSVDVAAGATAPVLENKRGERKAYRSKVAVVDGGQAVAQATIAVNAPFSYAGILMVSLGVLFVFYVRPRVTGAPQEDK